MALASVFSLRLQHSAFSIQPSLTADGTNGNRGRRRLMRDALFPLSKPRPSPHHPPESPLLKGKVGRGVPASRLAISQ
jgi:hypothetical protein